jgi:hypothetical protein
MASELQTGSQEALWQSLVLESEKTTGIRLDEELEAYLVFVLMRHARDAALLARVMALELLHACQRLGRQRLDELRDVGDRCLLLSGWYPVQAERRRVARDYFERLGRSAYLAAAEQATAAYGALFGRLAAGFASLAQVLAGTRRRAPATLRLWEERSGLLH